MGHLRLVLVTVMVLFTLGATPALAQGHTFTLRDHGGWGEDSLLYMYNGESLAVSEQAADGLPMLVRVVTLSPAQQAELDALAWTLWDTELEGSFTNPDITEGLSVTIAIADAQGTARQAYISNYRVQALAELVAVMNLAVPAHERSAYASAALPLLPSSRVIVAGVDAVFFADEVELINRGRSNLGPVLGKLRRTVRQGGAEGAEAQAILDAVAGWTQAQMQTIEQTRTDDLPGAYALALEASALIRRDALSRPFDQFIAEVRSNRSQLREVDAELALREAKLLAVSIGLGDDVEAVQWDNRSRIIARELGDRMDTIATVYRGTPAARQATEMVALWREQVRAIEARQPAWRYTWHIDLIPLGTEERVRIRTDSRGELVTQIDTEIVFDTRTVVMHGTFQNTSSEAHRYTFLVGVVGGILEDNPFVDGDTDQMLGFERVQTPVLQPGELYEWTAEVAVRNIRSIRRGGLGEVVADQPGRE